MLANSTFLYNRFKEQNNTIYLISHERTQTGAPIALQNINEYLKRNGVKTELLYFTEKKNIYNYILEKTNKATVIINTITLYDLVYRLSLVGGFKLFWYVHEWIDESNRIEIVKNLRGGRIFNAGNIHLLFPCRMCENNYKREFPNIRNSSILSYSYNLEKIEENSCVSLELNTNGNIAIGIIGTICSRKNQQAFINDVFYRILDERPYVTLILVGNHARPLKINPLYKHSISIIGTVDNALAYINACDIMVSYSLNEVMPLNIIEATYCAKPVVSSDVGGVKEIIEDGETGFLFRSGDSEKCYELLIKLIDDKVLRTVVGSEGKKRFFEKFSEETNFKPLLSLLK